MKTESPPPPKKKPSFVQRLGLTVLATPKSTLPKPKPAAVPAADLAGARARFAAPPFRPSRHSPALFPPVELGAEVLSGFEMPPDLRRPLRSFDSEHIKLSRRISILSWENFIAQRHESLRRTVAGAGDDSDLALLDREAQWKKIFHKRRWLKRERDAVLTQTKPLLMQLANLIEEHAIGYCLQAEEEERSALVRWGFAEFHPSPRLIGASLLTWAPSQIASFGTYSPRQFCKAVGIRL